MPLTQAEQDELNSLEKVFGTQKLSDKEAAELATLESQFGNEVVNEMPEGLQGRFAFKNFMNQSSPEAFNYLEKQNPGFELKKDENGEILARKRGATQWGRLDPKGFDINDITDVAYDIPAGIAQGAATSAGFLAGAGLTAPAGGWGALPVAMATGGGTGAGLNRLKSVISDLMYNTPSQGSVKEDLISAGVGAASPLLLGAGVTAGQAANLASKLENPELVKSILSSSKGVLSKAIPFTSKKVAETASGIPADIIENYAKRATPVNKMIEEGSDTIATQAYNSISNTMEATKNDLGKKLEDAISKSDLTFSPSSVFKGAKDQLEKLKSSRLSVTKDAKDEIKLLDTAIKDASEGLPENLSASELFSLQKAYKDKAQFGKSLSGLSPEEANQIKAFRSVYDSINSNLSEVTDASGLKKDYAVYKNLEAMTDKYFSDPEKTYKTLSGLTAPSKEFVRKTVKQIKDLSGGEVDLEQVAKDLKSYNYFKEPGFLPLSTGGTTSTSRSLLSKGVAQVGLSPYTIKKAAPALYNISETINNAVPNLGAYTTRSFYPAYLMMNSNEGEK